MFVKVKVRNAILIMLSAISFFGLETNEIKAAWGTFDASFGNGGTFQDIKPNSYPKSVLVQPDGKILVTGYIYLPTSGARRLLLRRFTASGAPDTTFGNNGNAVINAPLNAASDYGGRRIAMLSDGKIAVIGQAGSDLGIWLVSSFGYGDTSFGNNGLKIMPEYHYANGRIGANGTKIILGVYHRNYKRVIIHQLNADGSDDTNFGSDGKSYTGIFHNYSYSPSFEMITGQTQNKITIAGISIHPQYGYIKRIERVNQDGWIDFTFTPTQTGMLDGHITGIARSGSGDLVYSEMTSISVDFIAKLYKIDWNGTNVLTQTISAGDSLIAVQGNRNFIVGNGFTDNLSRYDKSFNFIDTASPNYYTYYVGAAQPDNKVVFATNVDNRLTLFRWLKD